MFAHRFAQIKCAFGLFSSPLASPSPTWRSKWMWVPKIDLINIFVPSPSMPAVCRCYRSRKFESRTWARWGHTKKLNTIIQADIVTTDKRGDQPTQMRFDLAALQKLIPTNFFFAPFPPPSSGSTSHLHIPYTYCLFSALIIIIIIIKWHGIAYGQRW